MGKVIEVREVNESARLEWLDRDNLILRVEYSSCFYGSCILTVRLHRKDQHIGLGQDSLRVEEHKVLRGDVAMLLRVGETFLRRILMSRPELVSVEVERDPPLQGVQSWSQRLFKPVRLAGRRLWAQITAEELR